MADNISVTEGVGKTVATDEIASVNHQYVKVEYGADGTAIPVTTANPLPVSPQSGTVTVSNPTGTTVQFNNGTVDLVKSGTITRVEGGTITVSNPTGTTVTVDHGTVTLSNPTGTTVQFNNGTVDLVKAGTITRLEGGTVQTNILTGTVTSVTDLANLAKGTVTRLEQGSVNVTAGTFRINPNPTVHTQVYGTNTAATIGTIIDAPSAGSAILIDSLDVMVTSGTPEWLVSYGLAVNGNGVITRGLSAAGGGISKNPTYPMGGSTTGSALTWNILSGSGSIAINLAYRVVVP